MVRKHGFALHIDTLSQGAFTLSSTKFFMGIPVNINIPQHNKYGSLTLIDVMNQKIGDAKYARVVHDFPSTQ